MKVLGIFAGLEKQNRVDCRKGNSFSPLSCKYGVFTSSQNTRKSVYILFKYFWASIQEYSRVLFLLVRVTEKRAMEFLALFNSIPRTSSLGVWIRQQEPRARNWRFAILLGSLQREGAGISRPQPPLHHCWSPFHSEPPPESKTPSRAGGVAPVPATQDWAEQGKHHQTQPSALCCFTLGQGNVKLQGLSSA